MGGLGQSLPCVAEEQVGSVPGNGHTNLATFVQNLLFLSQAPSWTVLQRRRESVAPTLTRGPMEGVLEMSLVDGVEQLAVGGVAGALPVPDNVSPVVLTAQASGSLLVHAVWAESRQDMSEDGVEDLLSGSDSEREASLSMVTVEELLTGCGVEEGGGAAGSVNSKGETVPTCV